MNTKDTPAHLGCRRWRVIRPDGEADLVCTVIFNPRLFLAGAFRATF
jgi:hypothetical protein